MSIYLLRIKGIILIIRKVYIIDNLSINTLTNINITSLKGIILDF